MWVLVAFCIFHFFFLLVCSCHGENAVGFRPLAGGVRHASRGQSNILVLHLGKNILVACSAVQLLENLTRDVDKISQLVWAKMPSRCVWCSAHKAIDMIRRMSNKQAGKMICRNRGGYYCPVQHSLWASTHLSVRQGSLVPWGMQHLFGQHGIWH